MQCPGKDFLADTGFSQQEHGQVQRRHAPGTHPGGLQHLAVPDDLGERIVVFRHGVEGAGG
ncbi:hypothetical protein D3C72_2565780 [compost metagenome]